MRKAVTLVAACALVTGVAAAQMKVKPTAPAQNAPLSVQGAQQQPQPNLDAIRRISTSEALKLADRGEAVIVDIRSNESFTLGHIRGAYSIPGSQLIKRLRELPPGKMIITYCA